MSVVVKYANGSTPNAGQFSFQTEFLKRMWITSPILLGLVNALSAIQSIGLSVGVISLTEAEGSGCVSCLYGAPTVQCPVDKNPTYIGLLYVWMALWASYYFYILCSSLMYHTYDLRFYLLLEKLKTSSISKGFYIAVVVLTFITCIIGFWAIDQYLIGNGSSTDIFGSIVGIVLFAGVSYQTLSSLVVFKSKYPVISWEVLKDEVPIILYKIELMETSESVIDSLKLAILESSFYSNEDILKECGDYERIKRILTKITIIN